MRSARCSASKSASAVVRVEQEAGALAGRGFHCVHRVGQPAGATHDRHRAVAQAVHLVQAARLVARRHEEHVGAGLDPVRELVVVARCRTRPCAGSALQPARTSARSAPRRCRARRAASPRAQEDGQHVVQQLEALLRRSAATRCRGRARRARGGSPSASAAARPCIARLAREVGRAEAVRDQRVASPGSTRRSRRRSGCRTSGRARAQQPAAPCRARRPGSRARRSRLTVRHAVGVEDARLEEADPARRAGRPGGTGAARSPRPRSPQRRRRGTTPW